MKKPIYTVVVGNVGSMDYSTKKLAIDCYDTYVTMSKQGITRAAGESVTLMKNEDIIKEHIGSNEVE